jgi:DNA polymerase III delta prime subunit
VEADLIAEWRSGRLPHALLIGGPEGVGKATLAYRMARFVLAFRNPKSSQVQAAPTLRVDPSDAVARQITAGAHGGLLVLERGLNDRGVMRTVITVDETRETISFFGSTAAVDGWRVCIVDTVDELNPNAANALLKILEEPPQQSLFLLVSHAPSRVLPTILSRCRKLLLRPLETDDVVRAAAAATDIDAEDPALLEAAAAIKARPEEVPARLATLIEERKRLERELADAKKALALAGPAGTKAGPEMVNGIQFQGQVLDGLEAKALRGLVDEAKQALGSGIVAIVAVNDGRASVAVGVTDDLVGTRSAVDLVRVAAAALGGQGGGGRPDMAQAGGPDADKAADAIAAVKAALTA